MPALDRRAADAKSPDAWLPLPTICHWFRRAQDSQQALKLARKLQKEQSASTIKFGSLRKGEECRRSNRSCEVAQKIGRCR